MAHFFTVVLVPSNEQAEAQVRQQLEQHHDRWDFYRIGGRWDGHICDRVGKADVGCYNDGEEHERIENNIAPVSQVLESVLAERQLTPLMLLSSEGWDEYPSTREYLQVLNRYSNFFAVAVDIKH